MGGISASIIYDGALFAALFGLVKSWCDHAGECGWQEHGGTDESRVFGIRAGCVSEFEIQKIKTKKALIISGE